MSHQQSLHWRRFRRAELADPRIPPQYPPDLELEPVHLDIDLHVDVAGETAVGTVTTTVVARGPNPQTLELNAVDFADVSVVDPAGRDLSHDYDGSRIRIRWDQPFTAGEERRVAVSYRVTSPVDGLYFSNPDAAYPNETRYASTDHETERARHWLPCIDLPNVRTTLDFHLRADAAFTILANGTLVDETDHGDGTKTAHWRLEQRCPSYLVCFAIGDFVHYDDGSCFDGEKDVPLAYFCSRDHTAEQLQRTFGPTGDMMAWMTKKLAMPFPYPKYYQFATPKMGGAMENISLVSWGETYVLDAAMHTELGYRIDSVNVHEMAHSYFGDAIVCRDFAHAWLKESWATYIEQVYREDNTSAADGAYTYYTHAQDYLNEADNNYKRPIVTRHFDASWQMYDDHLYPGGACRLHTLRMELGDDVFWTAVQDYLQRYNQKVVETDHFRHVMEEHSGRALGRFFDQWFHTAAYPDISVSFSYDADTRLGTFEVEQKQVDAGKNIPAFALRTTLSWTIDGEQHSLPIRLENAKHAFTVRMDKKPEMVRFDPDHAVLHKLSFNPGDDMLRVQLADAPDVIGRIQAAKELVQTGKRSNLQAVVDAYAVEPFWGVRREMAAALAAANHDTAVAGIAQCIATEQDPLVLHALIGEAGQLRDERVRDALLARVETGLPPVALQAAYTALGQQRTAAPFELLAAASEQESYNGNVQRGAFSGLAASRQEAAIDLLLARVPYGATSNYARWGAVYALAEIGKGQEKARRERIVETLSDLLRDPWPRVGRVAAYGLGMLRAPEAIPALEAYARGRSHQERVAVEEIITGLRRDDKVDGSAVKKQVEDLQKQVRTLEDRLEKLSARIEADGG